MKLVLLLGVLLSTAAFGSDMKVKCEGTLNYKKAFTVVFNLAEGEKNVNFAATEQHEFFLTSKGNGVVELQALDVIEPSRSYATGKLTADAPIELAIWKRDFLIETRCSLI